MARSPLFFMAAVLGWPLHSAAQMRGGGAGNCLSGTTVEIHGTVARVHMGRGLGMPLVVINVGDHESSVYLGSMRYLMAEDFNPKVGESIVAKAYKTANGLFAATVTLPGSKRTIRLRDESGLPMWRGGPRR